MQWLQRWLADWRVGGPFFVVLGVGFAWFALAGLVRDSASWGDVFALLVGAAVYGAIVLAYGKWLGSRGAWVGGVIGVLVFVAFETRFGFESGASSTRLMRAPSWAQWMAAGFILVLALWSVYVGVRVIQNRGVLRAER